MSYQGDWTEDTVHDFKFTSRATTGIPTVLSGSPTLAVYKDNSTTQSTAGITLTVDFDGVVGLNNVRIDTSADGFYAVGSDYHVVITAGTVGGVSVVGEEIGSFSIENRFMEADITKIRGVEQSAIDLKDFADDGYDPTTNKVAGVVLADTVTTLTNLPAITSNWLTAVGLATDAVSEIQSGLATLANQVTIKAVTDSIGATGTGLTAIPWNPAWDTEVQSEVDDAIIAKGLDHLVFTSVVGADIADNSIIARIASKSATADWDSYTNTTDSLEAIRDRGDAAWVTGGGGGGTGARTVLVTVNNGSTALENARVRMTNGAESYVLSTNASGQCTFSLDDATWTVAITKSLHTFTQTTLVVDGNETPTYSMTVVTPTISDPGYITVYGTCELNGVVAAGIEVYWQQFEPGSMGLISSRAVRTSTSNGSGYYEFTGVVPGGRYWLSAGPAPRSPVAVSIPSSATSPYELPSVMRG